MADEEAKASLENQEKQFKSYAEKCLKEWESNGKNLYPIIKQLSSTMKSSGWLSSYSIYIHISYISQNITLSIMKSIKANSDVLLEGRVLGRDIWRLSERHYLRSAHGNWDIGGTARFRTPGRPHRVLEEIVKTFINSYSSGPVAPSRVSIEVFQTGELFHSHIALFMAILPHKIPIADESCLCKLIFTIHPLESINFWRELMLNRLWLMLLLQGDLFDNGSNFSVRVISIGILLS